MTATTNMMATYAMTAAGMPQKMAWTNDMNTTPDGSCLWPDHLGPHPQIKHESRCDIPVMMTMVIGLV